MVKKLYRTFGMNLLAITFLSITCGLIDAKEVLKECKHDCEYTLRSKLKIQHLKAFLGVCNLNEKNHVRIFYDIVKINQCLESRHHEIKLQSFTSNNLDEDFVQSNITKRLSASPKNNNGDCQIPHLHMISAKNLALM
jgi:hypothetical protein